MLSAKGYTGTVTFDGATVTIQRSRFGRSVSASTGTRIPVSRIMTVRWKKPGTLINGYISFVVLDSAAHRALAAGKKYDLVRDENTVVVTRNQEREFLPLLDAVQAAVSADRPQQDQ